MKNKKVPTFSTLVAICCLIAGGLISGCSPKEQGFDKAKVELEVRQAFEGLVEGSRSLDLQAYLRFFDRERFVGLNSAGSNWNSFEAFANIVEPGFGALEKIESLTFPNVKVSVIDANTAVLVNEYEETLVLKSGQRLSLAGGGTQVWSKASGEWKLVSVSDSVKPNQTQE